MVLEGLRYSEIRSSIGKTTLERGIAYSGMLLRVALVRTDVSEQLRVSIIRVTRIGELGNLA
jgi:hypothetical protein